MSTNTVDSKGVTTLSFWNIALQHYVTGYWPSEITTVSLFIRNRTTQWRKLQIHSCRSPKSRRI